MKKQKRTEFVRKTH